jgi:hypothetical protein
MQTSPWCKQINYWFCYIRTLNSEEILTKILLCRTPELKTLLPFRSIRLSKQLSCFLRLSHLRPDLIEIHSATTLGQIKYLLCFICHGQFTSMHRKTTSIYRSSKTSLDFSTRTKSNKLLLLHNIKGLGRRIHTYSGARRAASPAHKLIFTVLPLSSSPSSNAAALHLWLLSHARGLVGRPTRADTESIDIT